MKAVADPVAGYRGAEKHEIYAAEFGTPPPSATGKCNHECKQVVDIDL